MTDVRRWVRRGLRAGVRRVWLDARPSSPTDLRRRHPDVAPRDGSTPTPEQRFVPDTVATGPWADKDPMYDGAWPSRVAGVTAIAFWTVIALWVRRRIAELTDDGEAGPAPDERTDAPPGS